MPCCPSTGNTFHRKSWRNCHLAVFHKTRRRSECQHHQGNLLGEGSAAESSLAAKEVLPAEWSSLEPEQGTHGTRPYTADSSAQASRPSCLQCIEAEVEADQQSHIHRSKNNRCCSYRREQSGKKVPSGTLAHQRHGQSHTGFHQRNARPCCTEPMRCRSKRRGLRLQPRLQETSSLQDSFRESEIPVGRSN